MMAWRLIALTVCIVILAIPSTAAERVVVRAGEHDGFSRVVLHLPVRIGWTLSGEKTTRKLVLDRGAIDWNFSDVFNRISRARIRDIKPLENAPGLSIVMACACKVDVFWHGASMLVVDVQDTDGANDTLSPPVAMAAGVDETTGRGGSGRRALGAALARSNPIETQATALALATKSLVPDLRISADSEQRAVKATNEARQTIARQVARATALGLVNADTKRSERQKTEGYDTAPPTVPSGSPEVSSPDGGYSNLVARTGADREHGMRPHSDVYNSVGVACVPNNIVNVAGWGTPEPFADQIGAARSAVVEVSDDRRDAAYLALARLYLYFGFGAEAEQIVVTAGLNGEAATVAVAMAQLLDGKATEGPIFDGQTDCAGDVALWSNLEPPLAGGDLGRDVDAVLRALTSLPRHLKTLLGPRIARALLENGKVEASARVLRLIDRSVDAAQQPDFALVRGEAAIAESRPDRAEAAMLSVVGQNTQMSPAALIVLIENRLSTGRAVPPGWAELAGSYAQEQGSTDIAQELRHSYLGALVAAGQFDVAFDELARLTPEWADGIPEKTADIVASYTTRNADDVVFLRHLGYAGPSMRAPLSAPVENEIARRLLNLGFPLEARDILKGKVETSSRKQRRLLRAEAALATSAPRDGIASLMGLEGEHADSLRARANDLLGEHAAAWPLYLASGNDDGALQQAILAEDWQGAAILADPGLARIIDLAEPEGAEGTLARSGALLEESEAARTSIAGLLDATQRVSDEGS